MMKPLSKAKRQSLIDEIMGLRRELHKQSGLHERYSPVGADLATHTDWALLDIADRLRQVVDSEPKTND